MFVRALWLLIGLVVSVPAPALAWVPVQDEPFDLQLVSPYQLQRVRGTVGLALVETSPTRLQELKARGVKAVCVINAGAWENWRPDSGAFEQGLVGSAVSAWPGERWLDVRAQDSLRPLLERRLDLCRDKGFDGALLRNLDGHAHETGFPITAREQIAYNLWLAQAARERGLAVGLMNATDLIPELVGQFDFVVCEGCFERRAAETLTPFRRAGKAAFVVEYTNLRRKIDAYCGEAAALDLQLVFKTRSLNGKLHQRCP